jgi:hypothetical protein
MEAGRKKERQEELCKYDPLHSWTKLKTATKAFPTCYQKFFEQLLPKVGTAICHDNIQIRRPRHSLLSHISNVQASSPANNMCQ